MWLVRKSGILELLDPRADPATRETWEIEMLRQYILMDAMLRSGREKLAKRHEERGATAVEYGLLVALIAVAIIITVTALGGKLSSLFSGVDGKITPPAP